jgi:hypothetical protein
MVELKASESEVDYDYESNPEGGKQIIDVEPSAMIAMVTGSWVGVIELSRPVFGVYILHPKIR